eukprot:3314117-Pleurochrysis_carterae.AAC.1
MAVAATLLLLARGVVRGDARDDTCVECEVTGIAMAAESTSTALARQLARANECCVSAWRESHNPSISMPASAVRFVSHVGGGRKGTRPSIAVSTPEAACAPAEVERPAEAERLELAAASAELITSVVVRKEASCG